jgi:two-component system nitrate/nitrite response regulator NarL
MIKYLLGKMGYCGIQRTSAGGGALRKVIHELKPLIVLLEADFYKTGTPYMLGQMLADKPFLRIGVFSLGSYPLDREMLFYFSGASGYVNLQDGIAEFHRGLRRILRGEQYFSRRVLKNIEDQKDCPESKRDSTDREDEVMRLLADGYTTREIAEVLCIGVRTVERHKTRLFKKYRVRNTVELLKVGRDIGKIPIDC